jgi:site-specific DNA-methyltransferase (adenine-specific)
VVLASSPDVKNTLFFGDNLTVLRHHLGDESVDLVYLDPPFKSNHDYNAATTKAFSDTWQWNAATAASFAETVARGGDVSLVMQACRTALGGNDMLAYLAMMAPRLVELHRVLKPEGSIYLHCDPTASHYLKLLMDSIFDPQNFLNEIIWHYRKWPSGKYTFQRNHDVILFYAKSGSRERVFNQQYMARAASTLKRFGTAKIISGYDTTGARRPSETSEHESEGVRMDDVWDIGRVPPVKQLYPTQKPQPLLERIIESSSNEGQLILDPFCGSGTSIIAAQRLNRRWLGIDNTDLAIRVVQQRLEHSFPDQQISYDVIGEPVPLQLA